MKFRFSLIVAFVLGGLFSLQSAYAAAPIPTNLSLLFVDVNGVNLYLGHSNGIFDISPISYLLNNSSFVGIDATKHELVGDINGDDFDDLVFVREDISTSSGRIVTRINNKDGSFGAPITITPITQPVLGFGASTDENTHLGDVNGDGFADLVFMFFQNVGSNGIYTYLSSGNGYFSTTPIISEGIFVADAGGALDSNAESQLDGDFNGDGSMDIFYSLEATNRAMIYLSNGDGTFGDAILTNGMSGWNIGQDETESTEVGDFNHDSVDDIVHFASGYIRVWFGSGDGYLNPNPIVDNDGINGVRGGSEVTSASFVGDTNNDGYDDLIWMSENDGGVAKIVTVLANGDGTFTGAIIKTGAAYPSVNFGVNNGEATHIGYFLSDMPQVNITVSTGVVSESYTGTVFVTATVSGVVSPSRLTLISFAHIGSAALGSDYGYTTGNYIELWTGTRTGTLNLSITNDNSYEGLESINIVIDYLQNGWTGTLNSISVDIISDDFGAGKVIVIAKDICPDGDNSPTQYDKLCSGLSIINGTVAQTQTGAVAATGAIISTGTVVGTGPVVTTGIVQPVENLTGENTNIPEETPVIPADDDTCADAEIEQAYEYAKANGVTTMPTCKKARPDDFLTRGEAAKMIVNFALNVRHIPLPETDAPCRFSDMTGKDIETHSYAIAACNLGFMGLKGDGTPAEAFNPDGILDKAQFATILSRMIYGNKNNDTACWYCKHVDALKALGVITVTTDLEVPLKRGWAMLMLMRVK